MKEAIWGLSLWGRDGRFGWEILLKVAVSEYRCARSFRGPSVDEGNND